MRRLPFINRCSRSSTTVTPQISYFVEEFERAHGKLFKCPSILLHLYHIVQRQPTLGQTAISRFKLFISHKVSTRYSFPYSIIHQAVFVRLLLFIVIAKQRVIYTIDMQIFCYHLFNHLRYSALSCAVYYVKQFPRSSLLCAASSCQQITKKL